MILLYIYLLNYLSNMIKYDILQFSVVVDTLWWTKDYHQHTLSLACNSMKVVKAEQ